MPLELSDSSRLTLRRIVSPAAWPADGGASVLVGGGHPVARAGLCHLLATRIGCRVVGDVGDVEQLLVLAKRHAPDLTIVELAPTDAPADDDDTFGAGWLAGVAALRADLPRGRVLLVCTDTRPALRASCARVGAHGLLRLTETASADLRQAVDALLAGEEWFRDDHTSNVASHQEGHARDSVTPRVERSADVSVSAPHLTRREREVLLLVADGKTSRQIALQLGISPRTVEAHRESITRKLGVSSVAGLTRYVMQHDVKSD